jgi:hypothetical protein
VGHRLGQDMQARRKRRRPDHPLVPFAKDARKAGSQKMP